MPGRIWYWLAAAVLAAGLAGAALFLLPRLARIEEGLLQVVVPGSTDLALAESGRYTIFHEPRSVVGGTLYHVEDISGLTVTLHALPAMRAVPLTSPFAQSSYSFGARAGNSIFSFEIEAPGDYRLTAGYVDGRAGPATVLALGQGFVGRLLTTVFGTIGIGLGGLGAATAIAVVTLLKRRSALRAAAGAAIRGG
jgi:hypothetical protein